MLDWHIFIAQERSKFGEKFKLYVLNCIQKNLYSHDDHLNLERVDIQEEEPTYRLGFFNSVTDQYLTETLSSRSAGNFVILYFLVDGQLSLSSDIDIQEYVPKNFPIISTHLPTLSDN